MSVFQVLILLFIAFVIFRAAVKLKQKQISVWLFGFWTLLWLIVALIDIFPMSVSYVANMIGVGRGVDLIIYLAVIILFYAGFRLNLKLNKIEEKMTELVGKIAVDSTKKNQGEN
ncbi:MAG TPA: DUF2304 family protein [Patescibacteria group bacterium]|nr:DUF2304 family protein [Patescibacteria group bacterium]